MNDLNTIATEFSRTLQEAKSHPSLRPFAEELERVNACLDAELADLRPAENVSFQIPEQLIEQMEELRDSQTNRASVPLPTFGSRC